MTTMQEDESYYDLALAIVGMAGRFPGAGNVTQLWQNLTQGVEAVRQFSDEEVRAAGVDPEWLGRPNYVQAGTTLDGIQYFDAPFFGYAPREAETLDPQVRHILECSWAALEDAGYDSQTFPGRVGVFAGKQPSNYRMYNLQQNPEVMETVGGLQLASGHDADALASLIAYKLNLTGPSISVQTFCSTSLVAVHLACQSLLTQDCDMALAGGVAIEIPHGVGYLYEDGGILSPDGKCRAFDARSEGSVLGNGLGMVVLKRLEDAVQAGDHIYAIIRGSAVNNDGIARVSYGAPGLNGQAAVIAAALGNAGVDARTIGYIETHGTGTALGDAVEMGAMRKVFGESNAGSCAIGSIKPSIGHLDRASGVTNLIKAALALRHKQLPPTLNFERANPDLRLESSAFYVNTTLQEWARPEKWPRRAGVSSFGLGGTNAHVVLEEAPDPEPASPALSAQLLVLSAKTEGALESATQALAHHLNEHPEMELADVAYTLQVGRTLFNYRRMLVAHDLPNAIAALSRPDGDRSPAAHQSRRDRPVRFLFPDGDIEMTRLAAELYETEPTFKAAAEGCAEWLPAELRGKTGTLFTRTASSAVEEHLSTFIAQYALAQVLREWGIEPQAVMGTGTGEYVAACFTGVLSLEDALKLVAARAANADISSLYSATSLHPADRRIFSGVLGRWIEPKDTGGLEDWIRRLGEPGATIGDIAEFPDPEGGVLLVVGAGLGPLKYAWGYPVGSGPSAGPPPGFRVLPSSLQRSGGRPLGASPTDTSPALGAGQQLAGIVRQRQQQESAEETIFTIGAPMDGSSGRAALLTAIGNLWLAGVSIDWQGMHRHERRRRVPLPTYPFERLPYWIEPSVERGLPVKRQTGKKADIGGWFYLPTWRETPPLPDPSLPELVSDHPLWLLFVDEHGVGARLAAGIEAGIEAAGGQAIQVQPGPEFARLGGDRFQLDPRDPQGYYRLMRSLPGTPTRIVHLWGLTSLPAEEPNAALFSEVQEIGYYSVLQIVKAVEHYTDPMAIWLVTRNAQAVTGEEDLNAEMATMAALCPVIRQENPHIVCRAVDVALSAGPAWRLDRLAGQLLAEFAHPADDLAVAYRGTRRWVQSFEPTRLEAPQAPVLRQGGAYLLTGGLGGIGPILTRYLGESAQAKIAITTRSGFPPRAAWPEWLDTHTEDDPVSRRIGLFQSLEAQGAEIAVFGANVADEERMAEVLAEIERRFGALNGVFHVAGISGASGFAPIHSLERAQCEEHFGPKAYGLYVLERLLTGRALDFCVLWSSLASQLGGLQFGAYAPANAFIDAFVHRHNRTQPQWWTAINWDTWRTHDDQHAVLGATVAEYEMTPQEALQAFERVVAHGSLTQVVNSTGNLEARLDQWVRMVGQAGPGGAAGSSGTRHPRPDLLTPYVGPTSETEELIAEIWQEVLGIDSVGIHDNFLELGGHSLMATQVISHLRQTFQVHLPLTVLFTTPTVAELALAVEMTIIEELESLPDDEVLSAVASAV